MSWLRLDDKIATHRKTVQVGNEAFGAWVRMAAHCQGHATDGRITRAEARVFGDDNIIQRLVDVGFLDAIDGELDLFDIAGDGLLGAGAPSIREAIPRFMRRRVIERDGMTCALCGNPVSQGDLHIDHRVPWSRGGSNKVSNLQVSHAKCNMRKGARVDA